MTFTIVLQFVVVLAAIWMGARFSGVGLGLWGAVGLLVLVGRVRHQPDVAADRHDADHPRGDHGRVGDATRALMPLGMALGIPPQFLIGMFPSVNGYFFIPTYGSLIAAINFDLSGTTKIGKYVLNHSFMIPGPRGDGRSGRHAPLPREDHLLASVVPGRVRGLPGDDV